MPKPSIRRSMERALGKGQAGQGDGMIPGIDRVRDAGTTNPRTGLPWPQAAETVAPVYWGDSWPGSGASGSTPVEWETALPILGTNALVILYVRSSAAVSPLPSVSASPTGAEVIAYAEAVSGHGTFVVEIGSGLEVYRVPHNVNTSAVKVPWLIENPTPGGANTVFCRLTYSPGISDPSYSLVMSAQTIVAPDPT